MKLKKPMIIKAEIQRVDKLVFADKQKPGTNVTMYQVVMGDKSKHFRCTTPLMMNLRDERFEAKFGKVKNPSDVVDEPVTLAIIEMKADKAFIGVRGEIVKGHQTAEQMQQFLDASKEEPAAAPAPAATPKPQPSK